MISAQVINKYRFGISIFIDFILMSTAFLTANYLKNRALGLPREYDLLLLTFYSVGFVSAWVSRKYLLRKPKSFEQGLQPILRAFIYQAFFLLLIIFLFKLFQFSRLMIISMLLIYLSLEIVVYSLVHFRLWGLDVQVINDDEELYRTDAADVASSLQQVRMG